MATSTGVFQLHPSSSEGVLQAFKAQLENQLIWTGARIVRNEPRPIDIPPGGLLILRDGEPGEPEVSLSPLAYSYEHEALLEVYIQAADNDAAFDLIKQVIGQAIAQDRLLGGRCDWIEAEPPSIEDFAPEGAAPQKAALIPIRLFYTTSDPLI